MFIWAKVERLKPLQNLLPLLPFQFATDTATMNRSKQLLQYLKLANSLLSTRPSPAQFQVTRFSHHHHSLSNNFKLPQHFPYSQQKVFFSTKPDALLDLIVDNDWSTELEQELDKYNSALSHELVIYVLKKLDKNPKKAFDFFSWVFDKNGFKPSSTICSIMLRVLVNKENMKEFWVTLRKMKEQGYYLDEETYVTILGAFRKEKMANDVAALMHFYKRMIQENTMDGVVQKVVKVVLETGELEEGLKGLVEDSLLSDNFVLRALKELRSRPLKALSFFQWMKGHPSYEHNTVTYNAVARVLGRSDSIGEFWSVVDEMKTAGHEMDIDTYIKISRMFQKYKMLEDAVKLYEFMMDGPYKPLLQDCVVLLRSIAACGNPDLDLSFRVVKKCEASGHTLSKAVYDGLHRTLTSLGKFDEAEKIVEIMREAGYEPDNITFSQLVFGLCKAKRLDEACNVLDKMEASGCIPDIKTWTILIQGHCSANQLDKALICFAKMIEKNCDADADLLDVLINAFVDQKKIDGAYEFLIEMVHRARVRPWQATYKNLIQKLLEERRIEEALNLLVSMKKQNYPAFPDPFIQYTSKYGTVQDACDFLKALSLKDYPSVQAYVQVFQAFFNEGRHSEAKDLLYKCPHHIRKHDEICKLFGSSHSAKAIAR